ncbi:MAG: AmmeMemoRadiSam system radical SAM enzyme [Nanoarchaeota archaeon]|nr:AmmeMemoRadiSam system radical SAM enzyme [Nanoarchaeota archaeon]
MEKEAMFYRKLGKDVLKCELCPNFCVIKLGERGTCRARENRQGTLIALGYGKPCSTSIDSIEKKPFAQFYPGSKTLTLAVAGCNLACKHCQNWHISQSDIDSVNYDERGVSEIVKLARDLNSNIISFSYTEPTIFYEYMHDIAKLAQENKMKTAMISNGFINPEPLKKLIPLIDAFNIDLKSINSEFYEKICDARLEPVLETLKAIRKSGKHLEVTNLIIPGMNDSESEIKELVGWVIDNLGKETCLHFSAFYPQHKMINVPATRAETVLRAAGIARKLGMKNVYTGNI